QEVDDHWHAAGGQARRGGEAEELLDAGSEHRRAALFVTQVDAAAGGHGEALRGFAFEGGELRRRHHAAQRVEHRSAAQLGERAAAGGEGGQQRAQLRLVEGGERKLRLPAT